MSRIHLTAMLLAAGIAIAPAGAEAGMVLELSAGQGYLVKPWSQRAKLATNVMAAPGFTLTEMLRFEVGVLATFGNGAVDFQDDFTLQLRPMLVIDPPLLPFYGRAIFAFTDILSSSDREIAYGGALGLSFSLLGVGIFAEAGLLPIGEADLWVFEGRVGAYISF